MENPTSDLIPIDTRDLLPALVTLHLAQLIALRHREPEAYEEVKRLAIASANLKEETGQVGVGACIRTLMVMADGKQVQSASTILGKLN